MQAEPYSVGIATVAGPAGSRFFLNPPFDLPAEFAHPGSSRIYVGDAEIGHDPVVGVVATQSCTNRRGSEPVVAISNR